MEYIKTLSICTIILCVVVILMCATRLISLIVWKIKDKINSKVNKEVSEYQKREHEQDERYEMTRRISELQMELWDVKTKLENNKTKKKGSK